MNQKKIYITGASHGLGLELTQMFLDEGSVVYTIDRDKHPLEGHERLHHTIADLLKDKLVIPNEEFDIVISNLGTYPGLKYFKELTDQDIENSNKLNILIPTLLARNAAYKKIVFISSVCSQLGFPMLGLYSGAKAYLALLNESLRREGIKTMIVFPYKFNSGMFNEVKDLFTMRTTDVAKAVMCGIKKEKKEIYLPWFSIISPYFRILPTFLQDWIMKKTASYFYGESMARTITSNGILSCIQENNRNFTSKDGKKSNFCFTRNPFNLTTAVYIIFFSLMLYIGYKNYNISIN
ncbi:putative short chain dehydrogenase [Hamiltosporidium magnivora]|uniref:Putative short chain dehydrogenase n=1 Tax=Hamiltosporidium magnivora TaxID=148818 RepID=A0A4V2JVB3_9MICR|nr:putative short chain dehydrogenase [Hamiltosporidium magnivora]